VTRYSVIIPAWNAARNLDACLQAVLNQSVPRDEYEVLVVDDGSTDETAQIAARHPIRLIRQAHAGPASARNNAARHARGQILLFTDSDCVPVPGWIREIARPLEEDCHVAASKGVYRTHQRGLIPRLAQVEFEEKYAHMRRRASIDFVDTSSAAVRADAFWRAGGFDTGFPQASNEDTQLSFTLAAEGWRIAFAERGIVEHRHSETLVQYLRRKWRHGYWRVRVYGRHPRKLTGDSYTPRSLQIQMGCGLLSLVLAPFPATRRLALACLGGYVLATLPFVRRAMSVGGDVALMVPLVLLLRAWVLGCGLAFGALKALADMRSAAWREQRHAVARPS